MVAGNEGHGFSKRNSRDLYATLSVLFFDKRLLAKAFRATISATLTRVVGPTLDEENDVRAPHAVFSARCLHFGPHSLRVLCDASIGSGEAFG